jgi:DUF4097 and DUF4098 domain-containing protein YvlB
MRKALMGFALLFVAAPLAAQDHRFTRELRSGERMEIENINGSVTVSQGTGRTALVEVTKVVKEGNGDLVKAVMEANLGAMRVCTIYLNRDPNRTTCRGENSNSSRNGRRSEFQVEMNYVVRVPAGVTIDVETVNGNVVLRGLDTPASVETVNGNIEFEAVGAHRLETVNGRIMARLTGAGWSGSLDIETVNGTVDLTLPANFAANVSGETVNGGVSSDFPITIEGRWGPKSFRGTINGGGSRCLTLETVNGAIRLRRQSERLQRLKD